MNGNPVSRYIRTEFMKGKLPNSKLEQLCITYTLVDLIGSRQLLSSFKKHTSKKVYEDFQTLSSIFLSNTRPKMLFSPMKENENTLLDDKSAVYEYDNGTSTYTDIFEDISKALYSLMNIFQSKNLTKKLPREMINVLYTYSQEVMIKTIGNMESNNITDFLHFIMSASGMQKEISRQIFSTFIKREMPSLELGFINLYLSYVLNIPFYTIGNIPIHSESYVAYILTIITMIVSEEKYDFFVETSLVNVITVEHIVENNYKVIYEEDPLQNMTNKTTVFIQSEALLYKLASSKLQLLIICCFKYENIFEQKKRLKKTKSRIVFAPFLKEYISTILAEDLYKLLRFIRYFAYMNFSELKVILPSQIDALLDKSYTASTKNVLISSALTPILMNDRKFIDKLLDYFVPRGKQLTSPYVLSLFKLRLINEMLFFGRSSENLYQYMQCDPDINIHEIHKRLVPLLFYAIAIHDNKLFDFLVSAKADMKFHAYYDGKIITPYEHAVTHGNSYAESVLRKNEVKIVSSLTNETKHILEESNESFDSTFKKIEWNDYTRHAYINFGELDQCIKNILRSGIIDDKESLDLLFVSLIRMRFPFVMFEDELAKALSFTKKLFKKQNFSEIYVIVSGVAKNLYELFGCLLKQYTKVEIKCVALDSYDNIKDIPKTCIIVFNIDDVLTSMFSSVTFLAIVPYDRYINRKLLLTPPNVIVYNTIVDLFCTCLLLGNEVSACMSFKYLYNIKLYRRILEDAQKA